METKIAQQDPKTTLLPTLFGDATASLGVGVGQNKAQQRTVFESRQSLFGLGSGDTELDVNFLTVKEATEALDQLSKVQGGEVEYQQWYHMAQRGNRKQEPLHKLRRLKRALANNTAEGLTPHYRFPVNDQNRYGVQVPMSPTIEQLRARAERRTGLVLNHAVILLYRDGEDCIGFHKDKTLDLDDRSSIVSISLGAERPYVLRDDIFRPNHEQEFVLPHGSLLVLGPATNQKFYHSIRTLTDDETKCPTMAGTRISLTFRNVATFKDRSGRLTGKGAEYQTLNWPEELQGEHRYQIDLDLPPQLQFDHEAKEKKDRELLLETQKKEIKKQRRAEKLQKKKLKKEIFESKDQHHNLNPQTNDSKQNDEPADEEQGSLALALGTDL